MAPPANRFTIALLPWGDVFEDFLDTIGVSLEAFCQEMTGGWLFGYVEALQTVGLRPVIVIFSAQVPGPTRMTHAPTGATICVLPASRLFRSMRWLVLRTESWVRQAGGDQNWTRRASLPLQWVKRVLPYLSTPPGVLARELRRQRCSAMLCQEYEYARFDACVLLGRFIQLPVFAAFQGGSWERGYLGRWIRSLLIRSSAGLIIAAGGEAQRVRAQYKVPPAKLARIFNPLDLRQYPQLDRHESRTMLHIPCDAAVVAWHGRISMHIKGLDILLSAWEILTQAFQGRDLRLLLIGTGEDEKVLRQRLEARPLPGVCWVNEYLHERTVLRRYISAGDVYALASRREGFPVAPLEAMACGLPVVATDVRGIADIFEHGEASGGIVVPAENAAALAGALIQVLDDPAWGRELGRRARRRIETAFSIDAVGQQLREFLVARHEV